MRSTGREKGLVWLLFSYLAAVAIAPEGLAREAATQESPGQPQYTELVQPVAHELRLRTEAFVRESSLDHSAVARSRLMLPHESLLEAMKEAPAYDIAQRSQTNGQSFLFTPFAGEKTYFLENLYTFDRGRVAEWRGIVRDATGAAVGEATMRFYSDGRYRWHISAGPRQLVVRSTSDPRAAILIEISSDYRRSRNNDDIPGKQELEDAYREMLRLREQGKWQWEVPASATGSESKGVEPKGVEQ